MIDPQTTTRLCMIEPCCICGIDCSTHPDAGSPLEYCGDCGRPTCPDHREESLAARCTECQHTRMDAAVRNALKAWFPWLACPEITDHDLSGADTIETLDLMFASFGGRRETLCDDCRETAPLEPTEGRLV